MKYSLGLDIGTTSIGWAIIDEENKKIERLGVRLFDEAENPKDGSSLAEPRRLARSARRRLRRRRGRLDAIIDIFIKYQFLSRDHIHAIQKQPQNPIELRAKGLDEQLTPQDLFVALFHIAKRRGYQSNRKKVEATDKESGPLLKNANLNHDRLAEYRTVGEMFAKDSFFGEGTRTRNKKAEISKTDPKVSEGGYKCTVLRDDLRSEVKLLFDCQRKFVTSLSNEFERDVTKAIFDQKPFANAGDIEEKVGKCEFIRTERRAAKSSYTFELSRLLQNINHLSIIDEYGSAYKLGDEERKKIIDLAHEQTSITYKKIRKVIGLPNNHKFKGLIYKEGKDTETAGGTKFSLSAYHEIRKVIEKVDTEEWKSLRTNVQLLDAIAEVLTLYKTDDDIREQLHNLGLSTVVCNALTSLNFTKFGNLSLEALKRIQPHLEKGNPYIEACDAEGFKPGKFATRDTFLKGLDKADNTLTNPVMKRAVSQTIKVINAVVREYGAPHFVKIECAHDLSRNHADRVKIQKKQEENRNTNEQLKEQAKELGVADPKGFDLLKLRLYREQQGKCAYTLQPLDEHKLFTDHDYAEVDHIIPYSRSGDDRNLNKVLVISGANRDKLNHTPYEWFGSDEMRWSTFEAYVQSCRDMHPRKKEFLITKKYTDSNEWTNRALNDTRYITRFLSGYIDAGLIFAEGKEKRRVIISNGSITGYLRRRWRIEKDRETNHLHHAADAAVIATISPALIQQVALYSKASEIRPFLRAHVIAKDKSEYDAAAFELAKKMIASHESHASNLFPKPWDNFDAELREKVKEVFVSYAPNRKVSGQAHKESLLSPNKEKREKKKKKKVESGILINKEKIFVENGDMLCVDIFEREVKGKHRYFVVPVYIHQTVQTRLPSAILPKVAGFENIDESFVFCFRLYPRDLVRLTFEEGDQSKYLYFRNFNCNGGGMIFDSQDGSLVQKNLPTLYLVEKCVVDPLGKVSIVHKETRLDFCQKKR